MVKIVKVERYAPEIADKVRGLLKELSRSGKDKGEIPESWFLEVINSPWHDLLVAEEGGEIIGMLSVSIIMGAGIGKNAYLEDFVVSSKARGKGVGSLLWGALLDWSREKGAKRLEFTCGEGREVAQAFYKARGAEIYKTNFFRKEL